MATELDELLASIRNCKSEEAITRRLATISEKKSAATDPAIARALRDAEVYALIWGVFVAALDNGAAKVAFDNAGKALESAIQGSSDNTTLEAAYATYENACTAYQNACKANSQAVPNAIKLVTDDAAKASPGQNGRDAIADADAAEMANSDIYRHLANQHAIYDSKGVNLDHYEEYYNKQRQIRKITNPVRHACDSYLNSYVTRARVAAELKQSMGKYLLVWRKTTSGGGNPLAVQGILESIDEKNGTFVLRSTVYEGRRDTASFSDINTIDKSRTGPGALTSAVKPDWRQVDLGEWVRSDQYYKYKGA